MPTFNPNKEFERPKEGRLIQVGTSHLTIVDDEDFLFLSGFPWHASIVGNTVYAIRRLGKKNGRKIILMHREIMNPEGKMTVDHKNGNGLDNRRKSNLRICTKRNNIRNCRKFPGRIGSKYKGVCIPYPDRSPIKYRANISGDNGEKLNLGLYLIEEEAAIAFDRAAREIYKEFARTNFPYDDGRVIMRLTK